MRIFKLISDPLIFYYLYHTIIIRFNYIISIFCFLFLTYDMLTLIIDIDKYLYAYENIIYSTEIYPNKYT